MSKPQFYKRHYNKIAAIFRRYENWNSIGQKHMRCNLACDLADCFKKDNPNFDWDKFVIECGFPDIKRDDLKLEEDNE